MVSKADWMLGVVLGEVLGAVLGAVLGVKIPRVQPRGVAEVGNGSAAPSDSRNIIRNKQRH